MDVAPLNRAQIANEFFDPHVPVNNALVDIDEIGASSLDIAENPRVTSNQGAPGKQFHIAPDLRAPQLTPRGDVEVALHLDVTEVGRAVSVLRADAGAEQAAQEKDRDG